MSHLTFESAEFIDQHAANVARSVDAMRAARAYIEEVKRVLAGLIAMVDESRSASEGHYPEQDGGCLECTLGTVPDKWNTGLCAYHKALAIVEGRAGICTPR